MKLLFEFLELLIVFSAMFMACIVAPLLFFHLVGVLLQ